LAASWFLKELREAKCPFGKGFDAQIKEKRRAEAEAKEEVDRLIAKKLRLEFDAAMMQEAKEWIARYRM
jgi:hypothetical protein